MPGGSFVMAYAPAEPSAVVGFRPSREHALAAGADSRARPPSYKDSVPMLPSDEAVSFRVFIDTNVCEVYFMGGRAAMTVQIPTGSYGVEVVASPRARLLNATSWQMGSIWATKEEVLATPRLDGK